ncbi:MAG: LPP20 family lipoprotein [Deltaproteobacteria bacterium]|nr:LPP20 family lipoprotein [Deltaproteobacteria bacterium]
MKHAASIITLSVFVIAILIGAGCPQHQTTLPPEKQPLYNPNQTTTPQWVFGGGGAQTKGGNKILYGVGSAPKMIDISMQRDRAINRGRAEILKIFNTYIAYMMKDYARSTTAGDMSKESYESDVIQVQKTISIGDLNGAQLADTWRDPADGTIYVQVVLDLAAVRDLLAGKGELDAKLRDYVRANAAKAFDDLEKEEAKRGK